MMNRSASILLLFLFASVACASPRTARVTKTPNPTIAAAVQMMGDGGLISQQPCGPPCLLGVRPGMARSEAIATLEAGRWGAICQANPSNISCPAIRSYMAFDATNTDVDLIYFYPEGILVQDLVDEFGDPTSWQFEPGTDELGHTAQFYSMTLYYDEPQMMIELETQERADYVYSLSPQSKIEKVIYQRVWRQELENTWNGYGEYRHP